jgi:hypothetical protein
MKVLLNECMKTSLLALSFLAAMLLASPVAAQQPASTPNAQQQRDTAAAEKAFGEGNAFMEQGKYRDALARYKEGL